MDSHKVTRIVATVVGSVVGIVIIILGFKLFQNTFTRADDSVPRDVVVSEITQNSVKATWSTAIETQGVIEYGTSPTALNFFAPEAQKTIAHSIDLTLLSPATTYYFQVRVADKKHDNGGVPWTFTTKSTDRSQPSDQPAASDSKPVNRPSPVSKVAIPAESTVSPTEAAATSCNETDCVKIKAKIGNGCTVQDYLKCTAR